MSALGGERAPRRRSSAVGWLIKHLIDWFAAALLLVLIAPLMLVIAVAITCEDRGPVLSHQTRVGRHGRPFVMLRFRSTVVDVETRRDLGITRVGAVLRRYSLDGLPQLFTVLGMRMSLVGPRPPTPREVEQFGHDAHRRLSVRPGLTGLWQISGRSDLSWEEAARLDLRYVESWCLKLDVHILRKAVGAVLDSRGSGGDGGSADGGGPGSRVHR